MEQFIPDQDEWPVPTVVQMEMAKWVAREASDPRTGRRVVGFGEACVVADPDTDIAPRAVKIGVAHKLSTADAIIYATALAYGADLLTCDAHFQNQRPLDPGAAALDRPAAPVAR